MTLKELNKLIKVLQKEVDNGIDVEFNKKWIATLKKQVNKALEPKRQLQTMIKKTEKIIDSLKGNPDKKTELAFYTGMRKGLEYCNQQKKEI